ncbi:2-keto-4-pentenoate hydratase [Leptospira wolffii]|uniref:2-keto-4-pentenoate hydratase n=1 Tax=Leptospira wolffii TaxID=409998 RepID=UPI00034D65C3|nr:fumarylacetoacetate hydrolase family protein [Leptospira wolffii]TGK62709.1 2-keto-4-pentenoate hydratase [Leptospira wolffii]TGK73904.1 2-keto-4-pentenoate hydratase [Leptospira wolffii]TGK75059.1 2-keto-4-pentenoate hydratase [Leptospira wolffii]TGL28766.1 2-keto-4-pentenoate hydratase [Leptospira wolffii]
MANAHIQAAAIALREARKSGKPIPPISEIYGIQGLEVSYEIAKINNVERLKAGAKEIGKKIGLTSKAVQTQLGVDQPDFGTLFSDMEYLDADEIPTSKLLQPKIEAEVAFILAHDLLGSVPSYGEFVNSIRYALPALEIVDSAIENWKIRLEDTVADNASCGFFVLGNQPIAIGNLDLAAAEMVLKKNGKVESVGSGAACLNHPLRAAYWLAKNLITRGQGLWAGEIILSGALGPMVSVRSGDSLEAEIEGLGKVSCKMI